MALAEIEFVYFDLGNVLVAFDPALACANVAEKAGITSEQADAVVYASGLQTRFETGEISGEEFADQVRRRLTLHMEQLPTPILLDAVSDMFAPIDSMRGVIDQVRRRGLRIGILSNTCEAHWDWISRQQYAVMDREFDTAILSYEVGSMKPDAAIYEAAEGAAGVSRERILFLDDRQENVEVAVTRGWHSVQCVGGPQAVAALCAHGVIECGP